MGQDLNLLGHPFRVDWPIESTALKKTQCACSQLGHIETKHSVNAALAENTSGIFALKIAASWTAIH